MSVGLVLSQGDSIGKSLYFSHATLICQEGLCLGQHQLERTGKGCGVLGTEGEAHVGPHSPAALVAQVVADTQLKRAVGDKGIERLGIAAILEGLGSRLLVVGYEAHVGDAGLAGIF